MKGQTFWVYWWWCLQAHHEHPFLRTTYSTRRKTAKQIQEYDAGNGWKLGKVHRMKVTMEGPPRV